MNISFTLDAYTFPDLRVQALYRPLCHLGSNFACTVLNTIFAPPQLWPLKPHSDILDALFSSDKMKALASFQDLYVGLQPYRNSGKIGGGVLRKTAPAVFGLLAALELHPTNERCGVYAPVGGFRAVGEAMTNLAKDCGVTVQCGRAVTRVTDGGVYAVAAAAPKVGGGPEEEEMVEAEFLPADLVVVNADLPFATETMANVSIGGESSALSSEDLRERYDWDDSFDFSSGVVAFHWSVSKRLDDLNTHNVFLSAENRAAMEKSWDLLRKDDKETPPPAFGGPFNFYVHRASKTDPTAAPLGCDSIMVLVPCQTLRRNKQLAGIPRHEMMERYKEQFDAPFISEVRRAVLKRLGALESLGDLENFIVDEVVDTPATYADFYNLAAGAPFALVSRSQQKEALIYFMTFQTNHKFASLSLSPITQSHGFSQLSLTRPGPRNNGFKNVLFVGASSRPGNGVPLVLLGAKAVATQASKRLSELAKM